MIYPNGSIEIRRLMKMVDSPEYEVYVEDRSDEPEDWDWVKQGFWRGPLTPIKNRVDLKKWIIPILDEEVELCYDITSEYSRKHPNQGESFTYVKPVFTFEYAGKANWAIKETETYYKENGEKKRVKSLDLVKYENEFGGICFVVGSWERDKEGYQFRSIGNRIFECIDVEDMEIVWEGLRAGDKYLQDLYRKED